MGRPQHAASAVIMEACWLWGVGQGSPSDLGDTSVAGANLLSQQFCSSDITVFTCLNISWDSILPIVWSLSPHPRWGFSPDYRWN